MPKVKRAQKRVKRLTRKRAKQLKRFRDSKIGSRARASAKRALARLKKAAKRATELLRQLLPQIGEGAWGGSKSIVEREIVPVLVAAGVPITSRKRWATYGNPSSDHYRGNRTAYAVDGGTVNNRELAVKVAKRLGIENASSLIEYRAYYIKRAGRTFRVQFIWSTHGTGPHLHIGVRRV